MTEPEPMNVPDQPLGTTAPLAPKKRATRKWLLGGLLAAVVVIGGAFGVKYALDAARPHRQPSAKITPATATFTPSGVAANPTESQGAWQKLGQDWKIPLPQEAMVNYYLASDSTRVFLAVSSFSKSTKSELRAYDGATGKLLWSVPFPNDLKGYPVAGNGVVVQADTDGNYIAYDTTSGQEKWRVHAKHAFIDRLESPGVFLNNVFYYTDPVAYPDKDTIIGVDAATGKQRYSLQLNNQLGLQTPRVANGLIIFGTDRGTVAGLSPDLHLVWQHQFAEGEQVPAKTYAFGNYVISTNSLSSGQSQIWAFNATTGKQAWIKTLPKTTFEPSSVPVVAGGVLAVRGNAPDWRVVGLNLTNGDQLWDSGPNQSGSFGRDGFGVADGTLFTVSHDIEIIDHKTGQPIFYKTMPYGSSVPPVAAGGHIVVVFADGLYGFN
jgi:outer membrane protein assembly factor BamB